MAGNHWQTSDELGEKMAPLIPEHKTSHPLESYLKSRGYEPHIQSRKEESDAIKNTDFNAHRWVVERTYSWMNRLGWVLTRWEKNVANYEAMLHFACSIIVLN